MNKTYIDKKRTSPALFVRQVRQELQKVTWPQRRDTLISSGIVILFKGLKVLSGPPKNPDSKSKFFEIAPLLLLFFISLNGNSIIDFKFFSINVHYILVYYWVLRQPESLGFGFIFLSGLISDVVFGFPLGTNALALLVIAAVAAYVRVVTVRITLINDWVSFIPALIIANIV